MIEIKNLCKKYQSNQVLNNISLSLPRTGLVALCGPSGSGKTTLLNCLSGLIDYQGSINIDGQFLENLNDKEKDKFRLINIGFVFQDFKLYENDSALKNVSFPMELLSKNKSIVKELKVIDALTVVGMEKDKNKAVKNMSGGEKQRVAIARAIINKPKIVLADEPTGALDSKNSHAIMKIFSNIAKQSLVIIVSHDLELMKKYANRIIHLKDGIIDFEEEFKCEEIDKNLPLNNAETQIKKPSIPLSFLLRHTWSAFKNRKARSFITTLVTSLGLIGTGLAFTISNMLSANIKNVYATFIDENRIVMTKKEDRYPSTNLFFGSYVEILQLKKKYPNLINDIGVCYYNDFNNYFVTDNSFYLNPRNQYIEGLNASHINEFVPLDDSNETFYPSKPDFLNDDQIAVSLTIDMVEDICFALNIPRTVNSLSNYLINNKVTGYFHFANANWQYDDEQLLEIKAFALSTEAKIYHSSPFWNVIMFEDKMRFPTIDNLNNLKHPWDLRKIYYLKSKDVETLLINGRFNKDFEPFSLEVASSKYFPTLFRHCSFQDIDRVLVFANKGNNINPLVTNYLKTIDQGIDNVIFGTTKGIAIFPEQLMMGFARQTYLCSNTEIRDKTIDALTSFETQSNENIQLPEGVIEGHFSKALLNGFSFANIGTKVDDGRLPKDTNEIVVSSSLLKKMNGSKNICFTYVTNEKILPNGLSIKEFASTNLSVVGVINSDKNLIYHYSFWPLIFFQYQLGVSIFDLQVNALCFSLPSGDINAQIKKYARAFPDYSFSAPILEINQSVEETCSYLKIALFAFSIIATIIAIILIVLTNSLFMMENKKDIGLARCIGVGKNESRKFLIFHSIFMCFVSYLIAIVEMFFISIVVAFVLANSLQSQLTFVLNPLSFVLMLVLCLIISITTSLIASKKYNNDSPLELLY